MEKLDKIKLRQIYGTKFVERGRSFSFFFHLFQFCSRIKVRNKKRKLDKFKREKITDKEKLAVVTRGSEFVIAPVAYFQSRSAFGTRECPDREFVERSAQFMSTILYLFLSFPDFLAEAKLIGQNQRFEQPSYQRKPV